MNRSRPSFRDKDAGARRAAQAAAVRRKRPPVPWPSEAVGTPGDAASSVTAGVPARPSEPEDQPGPSEWQPSGTDLKPVRRQHNQPVYGSVLPDSQGIVHPQEPPAQPQPVTLSAVAPGAGVVPLGIAQVAEEPATQTAHLRIETDYVNLLALAISLENMARDEIARLSNERPNDRGTIESNEKQCELLSIIADGFAKISSALIEYSKQPKPLLAGVSATTASRCCRPTGLPTVG